VGWPLLSCPVRTGHAPDKPVCNRSKSPWPSRRRRPAVGAAPSWTRGYRWGDVPISRQVPAKVSSE
jgi:hypothetical protein